MCQVSGVSYKPYSQTQESLTELVGAPRHLTYQGLPVAREERLGLRVLPQRRHLCDLHAQYLLGLMAQPSLLPRNLGDDEVHVPLPPDQLETPVEMKAATVAPLLWVSW